jgi:putative endonuclease
MKGVRIDKQPAVYILASKRNGTLYVGVTSDFVGRVSEHKQGLVDGFTKKYWVHRLVYIEFHDTMDEAIAREKRLKRWKRAWKIELIEKTNPIWRDLYEEISGLTAPLPQGAR